MGSQRVGQEWATSLSLFTFMHWRRKWQPTPVCLPREPQGWVPGGPPSMGSHRVRHDWHELAVAESVCVCACVHRERYFKELVHMIMHNDISKILGHPKLIGHQFWAADVATSWRPKTSSSTISLSLFLLKSTTDGWSPLTLWKVACFTQGLSMKILISFLKYIHRIRPLKLWNFQEEQAWESEQERRREEAPHSWKGTYTTYTLWF